MNFLQRLLYRKYKRIGEIIKDNKIEGFSNLLIRVAGCEVIYTNTIWPRCGARDVVVWVLVAILLNIRSDISPWAVFPTYSSTISLSLM